MQIGELSRKLDEHVRTLRYILERGHADQWVASTPGSGHHRDLTPGEAFALGLLVVLKRAGVGLPKAERAVDLAEGGLRFMAQQLGWEPPFRPFAGELQNDNQWVVEIGDFTGFRMATDANPSGGGGMEYFDWRQLGKSHRKLIDFQPCVITRIDLARLADRVRS